MLNAGQLGTDAAKLVLRGRRAWPLTQTGLQAGGPDVDPRGGCDRRARWCHLGLACSTDPLGKACSDRGFFTVNRPSRVHYNYADAYQLPFRLGAIGAVQQNVGGGDGLALRRQRALLPREESAQDQAFFAAFPEVALPGSLTVFRATFLATFVAFFAAFFTTGAATFTPSVGGLRVWVGLGLGPGPGLACRRLRPSREGLGGQTASRPSLTGRQPVFRCDRTEFASLHGGWVGGRIWPIQHRACVG